MPLFVTPSLLDQRAEFYHQLGSLISAGVPIIQSLEQLQRNPPAGSFRGPLQQLSLHLSQGYTLAEGMKRTTDWLPIFDLALLEAGEKSGRLDNCCRLLADYYRSRARLSRSVVSNLLYPVLIFHFAVLIFPTSLLVGLVWKGEVTPFLIQKLCIVVPLYSAIFFLLFICQGKRGEAWRSAIETIVRGIPILGVARRDLALARLAGALEALLSAGVPIFNAWELASDSSASPAMKRRVYSWRPQLEMGVTPSEMLRRSPEFPEMFANLYASGEISGTLDDTLKRLHLYFHEEGSRKMHAFAQWFPRLIYFAIVLMVAYQIIKFWLGYFDQIGEVLK